MLILTAALTSLLLAGPAVTPPAGVDDSLVIGVLPFGAARGDTLLAPLSYALADLLATDLARSRRLTIVERTRLGEVFRELALAASGADDSATAPRAGRLLGAHTLVVGSLVRRPDDWVVFAARLTDVGTGRVDAPPDAGAPLATVIDAEKELVKRLFVRLGVQLTPQELALVEQRPTRSLAALLAYGQGVRAEVNGQYAAAARAFRRAARADPGFRQATARAETARGDAMRVLGVGAADLTVDRVNRPLETVPATPRPGLATDPAGPAAAPRPTTLIIHITRP
jgi:TolB-like protein